MLIPIGTKVKFLRSNDRGTVTGWLDGDMLRVKLEGSGMEIPAFESDLIAIETPPTKVKAKIVPGKKVKMPVPPERAEPQQQYILLKDEGIQLAFDAIENKDGILESFDVYLINTTAHDVLYNIELKFFDKIVSNFNGKLEAGKFIQFDHLKCDELNDAPSYSFSCQKISTQGPEEAVVRSIKLKPNQLFNSKKERTAPLLNRRVRLYKVFDKLSPSAKKNLEDLRAYTRKKSTNQLTSPPKNSYYEGIDLIEAASFPLELDLHLDKLPGSNKKLTPKAALQIQMSHFEAYISKAILLGVERVFIIHGVGKGTLKEKIGKRLGQIPEVKEFKNEFHPKYKFGATEVIFK